jgi:septum formation protein
VTSVILASGSAIRAKLIESAGLSVQIRVPGLDERAVERPAVERGAGPAEVARLLAEAKALAVSRDVPDRIVIGADQTMALGARRFSKPTDIDAAREQLRLLRGTTHELSSAAAVARGDTVLWSGHETARLTMRAFSDAFLDSYLNRMGNAVTSTVGGYQLEGLGVQLFETIEGDYFTILGLPLLALLEALRRNGVLPA